MKTGYFILMVAPRAADARLVGNVLRSDGLDFTLKRVASKTDFVKALQRTRCDLILFDYTAGLFDAASALRIVGNLHAEIPVILLVNAEQKTKIPRSLKGKLMDVVVISNEVDLVKKVRRALREQHGKERLASIVASSRQNKELLRLLIEQVTDYAIYVLDSKGRAASWNAGAERMTGYSFKEALGKPLNHCFNRADIKNGKPARELHTALVKGRVQSEGWCRRKDGATYYAQWTITAIRDESGHPAGFLKVARDITERQRYADAIARVNADLEQRVRERTAQLEDANQELEAFSYSVSHDLRAPLRHIDGFVEILQDNAVSKLDAESRGHLRTIAQAARQMGKLIDALLSFSRLSRARVNRRRINLNLMMRDVLTELKSETSGRKIEWAVHKLPVVEADPILLKQALLNLVSNAIKYTGVRNRARIEIGAATNRREHVLFVRDNGVGFDMQHSDKLFGAFQRLHRASEFEGTGVGLANVRRIIYRHGGRTWAEGAVHKGATFYFSLPKEPKEAA